jgi:RND family efflux transporter MFP subunit
MSKTLYGFGNVILVVIVLAALSGCSGKAENSHKAEAPAPVIKGALLETAATILMPETVEIVGTVRSRTSAVVSTRIPGTITLLKVREGDRVRKGQLLIQLDAQENQANAAVAFSGIDEAQRGLEEALSRKKLADTTFERYQRLLNEQAISRQEFDVKQTERDLASQAVAKAEARLKQSQGGSKAASAISGYTQIVAPISGIISSKMVDLGAMVFPAQVLMTIEDEGSYLLELAIPESMAVKVKPGVPVQVGLDALNAKFTAKISELVPSADPASRTFIAKVDLTGKGLKSGMFGRGIISLGSSVNGMMLPKRAIVERGALTSVWIVEKDTTARMRLVKVGKTVGDKVEILSGLTSGERVVVGGTEKISEGAKVE